MTIVLRVSIELRVSAALTAEADFVVLPADCAYSKLEDTASSNINSAFIITFLPESF